MITARLNDLSVKTRLLAIVGLAFVGIALLALENYTTAHSLAERGDRMQLIALTETNLLGAIRLRVEQIHSNVNRAPSELDLEKLSAYRRQIDENLKSIHQKVGELAQCNPAAYGEKAAAFAVDLNAMSAQAQKVFRFAQNFSAGQANEALTVEYAKELKTVHEGLNRLTTLVRSRADAAAEELKATGGSAIRTAFFTAFIAFLLTIVPSLFLSRRISQQLGLLARATTAFANNDFSNTEVERIEGKDEIAAMAEALSVFKANSLRVRAMEDDLRMAKDAAESSSRAKSEFLANMSHEIRTPLNGVLGMAQSLASDGLPPDQQEKIDVILDSGELLTALLNDVLDFSKIEAGKLEIAPVCGDLKHTIERTRQLFQTRAEEKGLAIVVHYDPALPRHLVYDPVRVRQCVSNLLSNAIKFTDRGRIEISVSSQRDSDGSHLVSIAVSDTGMGINEEVLSRLFSVFTQADGATTRKFGGTGLGLAISRQLARLMGGDIGATSRKGVGSTFVLTFTGREAADEAPRRSEPARPRAPRSNIRGTRVLLTDDNATNRQVIQLFLAPHGCVITEATNGEEALAKLAAQPFDLVLLDAHMPVMDGTQTIAAIRSSAEPWSSLPVIALTADAMAGDREKYLALGMNDYITKPIDPRELMTRIHQVLNIDAETPRESKTS